MKKPLQENTPTNSMGLSSSTPGTGPIDTFDPVLTRKKVACKIMAIWKKGKTNSYDERQQHQ